MTNSAIEAEEETRRRESTRPRPAPVEDADVLDWDVSIERPPVHRSGTLRVSLVHAGRGKPIAVADPRAGG
jgi:hypothetical protein